MTDRETGTSNWTKYSFPMTVSGKLEFEMAFSSLERHGYVREIGCPDCYQFEFAPFGGYGAYGGIHVII